MKLFNKIVSASVLTLLALSSSTPAFAAGETSSAISTATVGVLDGSNNTDPEPPFDPETPGHPEMTDPDPDDSGNGGTGNNGPLSIDYVSNLNFGMNTYDGSQVTYHLFKLNDDGTPSSDPLTYNPWVQVTDKRNTGAGWNLTVNLDTVDNKGPFQQEDGTELKGAVLTFGTSTFDPKEDSNVSAAPTHEGQTIVSAAANTAETADKNAGMGTWFEHFDKNDTTLYVPAGNTSGEYTANLVWTLTDAAK